MNLFYNGAVWTSDDLKTLFKYKGKVKIEHLCVLIPNQTKEDIERKINELNSLTENEFTKKLKEGEPNA